ncbi:MAG: hypothetical protein RI955_1095 [Bacteroidota bacterium]
MEKNTPLQGSTNGVKQISSTLKTLCILTFIGVAILNFFGPIYHYYNIDKEILILEKQISKLQNEDKNEITATLQDVLDANYKSRDNKTQNLWVDIIAGILCIVGAALMMKLFKNGFFIYTIGELLPVIYHFFIFGFGKIDFSAITNAFSVVIPLTFVVLYAVQLKDME